MHGTGVTRLHYIKRKEKRSLGSSSNTAQMRAPGTSRIGHRCILHQKKDVWELLGFFSSMVQMSMLEMPMTRPRYIWHPASESPPIRTTWKKIGKNFCKNILKFYGYC